MTRQAGYAAVMKVAGLGGRLLDEALETLTAPIRLVRAPVHAAQDLAAGARARKDLPELIQEVAKDYAPFGEDPALAPIVQATLDQALAPTSNPMHAFHAIKELEAASRRAGYSPGTHGGRLIYGGQPFPIDEMIMAAREAQITPRLALNMYGPRFGKDLLRTGALGAAGYGGYRGVRSLTDE